jgi:S-formylglutathione hydrolase FrmB
MALIRCDYFSDVLGFSTSMTVVLPQPTEKQIGMDSVAAADQRPTLWLLHGMSDDHTIWLRRTSIERYVAPLGLAVVMPAVHRSYYTDMAEGGRYWTHVAEELPALARSFFPLSARREDNFVAGLSMGGYGAFKLALRRPDRYAAAASLSGAVDVRGLYVALDEERRPEFRRIFGSLDAFAGSDDDLFALADRAAKGDAPVPDLFQCCGTEDFLLQHNRKLRDHIRALGLKLAYHEAPGTHEWGFWDAWIRRVLEWLPLQR